MQLFVGFLVPEAVHTANHAACAALSRELGIRVEPPSSVPLHITVKPPFSAAEQRRAYLSGRLDAMVSRRTLRAVNARVRPPRMLDDVARPGTSFVCFPMDGDGLRDITAYLLDEIASLGVARSDHEGTFTHMTFAKNVVPQVWNQGALEVLASIHFPRSVDLDTLVVFEKAENGGWTEFHRVVLPRREPAAA